MTLCQSHSLPKIVTPKPDIVSSNLRQDLIPCHQVGYFSKVGYDKRLELPDFNRKDDLRVRLLSLEGTYLLSGFKH